MFDVCVIGGGPAGVTAALRARELGASVVLVERGQLGGTCTNDGCVPTRVLARAARLMRNANQYANYGITLPVLELDFPRLLARTQDIVYEIHEKKQLVADFERCGVEVFSPAGPARFVDPYTIQLDESPLRIEASRFILCAGGRAWPRRLSRGGVGPDPQRCVGTGPLAGLGRRRRCCGHRLPACQHFQCLWRTRDVARDGPSHSPGGGSGRVRCSDCCVHAAGHRRNHRHQRRQVYREG